MVREDAAVGGGTPEGVGLVRRISLIGQRSFQIDEGGIIGFEKGSHIAQGIAVILANDLGETHISIAVGGIGTQRAVPHEG